jgi:hypothetical protein
MTIRFVDASKTKIMPGHIYEIECTVVRENMSSKITIAHSFAIKPEEVFLLNTFILSSSDLQVTWPSSSLTVNNPEYLLNLYLDNKQIFTTKTIAKCSSNSKLSVNKRTPRTKFSTTSSKCLNREVSRSKTSSKKLM